MADSSITPTLREFVEQSVLPRYEAYDAAHRRDHVERVIERSLALAAHYDVRADMVYAVAAWHDLGLCYGRETHHLTSAQMLRCEQRLGEWFSAEEIVQMAEAIEDHRASSDHSPRSIYGLIVAEADRQIVPEVVMRRTVQYGLAHYPLLSREQQWQRFVDHLHEKYYYGGYLKLYIPHSDNAARLAQLRQLIDDKELLRKSFDEIFERLTGE